MLLVTVDVALDRLLVRDVLKAIISTIFFHRLFASVKPSAQPQEVLDVTYPAVEDAELDALIAEKVAKLVASLDANHNQDGGGGSAAGV
ncbi:autophagy-related protein [Myxozyma melibiosi]|uniref:Autophagy-related protein 101 n=1 Tax=Myxozyma melibiosi TaxID=54550 RepID=A0ABR1F0G1_9ASCO